MTAQGPAAAAAATQKVMAGAVAIRKMVGTVAAAAAAERATAATATAGPAEPRAAEAVAVDTRAAGQRLDDQRPTRRPKRRWEEESRQREKGRKGDEVTAEASGGEGDSREEPPTPAEE